MKDYISKELELLEKTEEVKILYACELGSRVWGFSNEYSDFDVRFVFLRPEGVFPKRDSLEVSHQNLDFSGWDLKKTLYLLYKNNPTLYEISKSPLVYWKIPGFIDDIGDFYKRFLDKNIIFNHYKGLAQNTYKKYILGNPIFSVNKALHVIRAMLLAFWIKENGLDYPLEIQTLYSFLPKNNNLRKAAEFLVERKLINIAFIDSDMIHSSLKENFLILSEIKLKPDFHHEEREKKERINYLYRKWLRFVD